MKSFARSTRPVASDKPFLTTIRTDAGSCSAWVEMIRNRFDALSPPSLTTTFMGTSTPSRVALTASERLDRNTG